jgi:protein-tyrosine-phosphatase
MIYDVLTNIVRENRCDWGVLLLGANGVPSTAERLSAADIASFANEQLESISSSDPALDLIVALAENAIKEPVELREALARICELEGTDTERARRIWRCWLLEVHVCDPEPDPVYGLLDLAQFWSQWGWPDDAPSSMKRDDDVSAPDYHSDSRYQKVLSEHRVWIEQEKRHLQKW